MTLEKFRSTKKTSGKEITYAGGVVLVDTEQGYFLNIRNNSSYFSSLDDAENALHGWATDAGVL